MPHVPVLLDEVIAMLDPKRGEFFVDGTFGAGGHSTAILEKIGLNGKLFALDWDESNVSKPIIPDSRFLIQVSNYADLPEILELRKLGLADGLILDLGVSSDQLDSSGRGFSFQKDEPLLMTYDLNGEPVRKILTELTEKELTEIIREYGEERYANKIAKAIFEQERKKPIVTTLELAELIKNTVPRNYERGRIHPATRTFQALRIYANHELENLERILKNLHRVVKPGGRVAIISFHSLEDRLVKNYFRDYAKAEKAKLLTKKPIVATSEEITANPRSRSAKLRVIQIL